MVPPQESPTFHAASSATPNSSIFGLPLSITSIASVTTAPSTQPPETEPRKLPSSSITRFEPTGRGAEPQVSTTVARATPFPPLRQSSAAFRMSSSRASVVMVLSLSACHCEERSDEAISERADGDCFGLPRRPRNDPKQTVISTYISRHPPQPLLRVARMAAVRRERMAQVGHRFEVVYRTEFV